MRREGINFGWCNSVIINFMAFDTTNSLTCVSLTRSSIPICSLRYEFDLMRWSFLLSMFSVRHRYSQWMVNFVNGKGNWMIWGEILFGGEWKKLINYFSWSVGVSMWWSVIDISVFFIHTGQNFLANIAWLIVYYDVLKY